MAIEGETRALPAGRPAGLGVGAALAMGLLKPVADLHVLGRKH